jgi:hypothetical protein
MNIHEYIHAHALVPDEAVSHIFALRMRAPHGHALGFECRGNLLFSLRLRGPADFVRGLLSMRGAPRK